MAIDKGLAPVGAVAVTRRRLPELKRIFIRNVALEGPLFYVGVNSIGASFCRPLGLCLHDYTTHGGRRGLHSCAASRLASAPAHSRLVSVLAFQLIRIESTVRANSAFPTIGPESRDELNVPS